MLLITKVSMDVYSAAAPRNARLGVYGKVRGANDKPLARPILSHYELLCTQRQGAEVNLECIRELPSPVKSCR